jgi:hypothetical protein
VVTSCWSLIVGHFFDGFLRWLLEVVSRKPPLTCGATAVLIKQRGRNQVWAVLGEPVPICSPIPVCSIPSGRSLARLH